MSLARRWVPFVFCFVGTLLASWATTDRAAGGDLALADGKIHLKTPEGWVSKEPKFKGIVDAEFEVPAVAEDDVAGRVTVGGAGGGVEANIDRWIAQYSQPDGRATEDRTIKSKSTIAGQQVHFVDLTGTYKGSRFSDEPEHADFRLLAAIIVTEKLGSYYVKFYGPKRTIAANEDAFKALVDSLKVDSPKVDSPKAE